MSFLDFPDIACTDIDELIEEENWSRTNADGLAFFDHLEINSDSEYVTKALSGIRKQCPDLVSKTGATSKSNAKSAATREKANELFKRKRWISALKQYSKSIALAENGSTELGFAYANRSALLLHRGFYKECLKDIDRALLLDYPVNKKPQLIARREKAQGLVISQKKKIIVETVPTLPTKNKRLRGASEVIKVAEDQNYGRYIQATRDIAPGEVILVEDPYVLVVGQNFKTTQCGNCANLCFNPIPCRNCSVELYCSEKCQDIAYNDYHQYECVVLNYYPPDMFNIEDAPETERDISSINNEQIRQLALRITLKGFGSYCNSVSDNAEDLYDEISKLQTHRNDLSKSALMVLSFNLAKQYEILKEHTNLLSKFHFKDKKYIFKYHLLRNRLICCFNLATLKYKLDEVVNGQTNCSPGIGLYISYSMFNHACVENVGYSFYGRTMVVRAIRKIKKGDQCFINYGQFFHKHHKIKRDLTLSRNYLFTCKCEACVKEWPLFDKVVNYKDNINFSAYQLIETVRDIIENKKIIDEEARQEAYRQCANIEHVVRNEGSPIGLVLLYSLLDSITVLRYQGFDF